jgi:anti-sigma regulatory factor (Ser/Thr protein kinase)
VGALVLGWDHPHRADPLELLSIATIAGFAAQALERAGRLQNRIAVVHELQQAMLTELPEVAGLGWAARYQPADLRDNVGGDWYDAIELENGALGIALGDVVGHGIGAAALMGQLRHAARAYALEGHSPAGVLDRLDRLVRRLEGGQMATLVYLIVMPDIRSVRFASAGHVPPLAIGPDGISRYLDGSPDPPLGVFDGPKHTELTATLAPGSTIVLYTDGLVEQRGQSIDAGLAALRDVAERRDEPQELCDHLVESMLAIHPADDDIAVLALHATGAPLEPFHLDVSTDPTLLRDVRRDVGRWLRRAGAGKEDIELIQMACHEACSNAIEHAYAFAEATFAIDALLDGGKVVLEVRDRGDWIERGEARLPHRGRGLALIDAMMDSVEVSRENGGTTVRMERRIEEQPVLS